MKGEIWKDIIGYEGYQASNFGRIKSLAKTRLNGGSYKESVMTPGLDTDGYLQVLVYVGGKRFCRKVHKLVLLAFKENPNNHPVINHIDGNRQNNHVSNLEWCTVRHNTTHAFRKRLLPTGVHVSGKNFRSIINIAGKNVSLGSFTDIQGASDAYQKALTKL